MLGGWWLVVKGVVLMEELQLCVTTGDDGEAWNRRGTAADVTEFFILLIFFLLAAVSFGFLLAHVCWYSSRLGTGGGGGYVNTCLESVSESWILAGGWSTVTSSNMTAAGVAAAGAWTVSATMHGRLECLLMLCYSSLFLLSCGGECVEAGCEPSQLVHLGGAEQSSSKCSLHKHLAHTLVEMQSLFKWSNCWWHRRQQSGEDT